MDGMSPKEVGRVIAARRSELKLSQEALARRAGVSKFTVQNLESGRYANPSSLGPVLDALDLKQVGHRVDGHRDVDQPFGDAVLDEAIEQILSLSLSKDDKRAMIRALINVYVNGLASRPLADESRDAG